MLTYDVSDFRETFFGQKMRTGLGMIFFGLKAPGLGDVVQKCGRPNQFATQGHAPLNEMTGQA
jgi:hypothetical protein